MESTPRHELLQQTDLVSDFGVTGDLCLDVECDTEWNVNFMCDLSEMIKLAVGGSGEMPLVAPCRDMFETVLPMTLVMKWNSRVLETITTLVGAKIWDSGGVTTAVTPVKSGSLKMVPYQK